MIFFIAALLLLLSFAQLHADAPAVNAPRHFRSELGLDLYYSSLRFYTSFSKEPVQYLKGKTEWEIYKELVQKSLKPRDLVLEASFNPLPYLGTIIRRDAPDFYNRTQVTRNLNLVQAVMQGFEEPWALSMFLGDVVEYRSIRGSFISKNLAYSGYLVSAGNFHILNSTLVPDEWIEAEWKVKGDEIFKDKTLRWSFRAGTRFNENHDVTNTYYLSVKRSRIDYIPKGNFFLNNSGFEYTVSFSQKDYGPVRHYFYVEKKFPLPQRRLAFTLAVGFVWNSPYRKYSGSLAALAASQSPFQVILRPNLQF